MSPHYLLQLLTEATQQWVSVRVGYDMHVFKCLSAMVEGDLIRVEAELKIDAIRDAPPQRDVVIRFAEDSPIIRTTLVLSPDYVTSVCIFQGINARPNDH